MAVHARYPDGIEPLLVHHEGERLFLYDDATGEPITRGAARIKGFASIGVGRNLMVRGIKQNESRFLLANDILDHWNDVLINLPWVEGLDRVRQMVILDMAFNLGVPGLLKFKNTLRAVQEKRFYDAAVHLLQSHPYVDQVGQRAYRLAEMLRSGKLPSDVKGLTP